MRDRFLNYVDKHPLLVAIGLVLLAIAILVGLIAFAPGVFLLLLLGGITALIVYVVYVELSDAAAARKREREGIEW